MNARLATWKAYPWKHLSTKSWPGRELWWIWCHPALSALIGLDTVITSVVYLGSR